MTFNRLAVTRNKIVKEDLLSPVGMDGMYDPSPRNIMRGDTVLSGATPLTADSLLTSSSQSVLALGTAQQTRLTAHRASLPVQERQNFRYAQMLCDYDKDRDGSLIGITDPIIDNALSERLWDGFSSITMLVHFWWANSQVIVRYFFLAYENDDSINFFPSHIFGDFQLFNRYLDVRFSHANNTPFIVPPGLSFSENLMHLFHIIFVLNLMNVSGTNIVAIANETSLSRRHGYLVTHRTRTYQSKAARQILGIT